MAQIPNGSGFGQVRVQPVKMGGIAGPSTAIADGLASLGAGISNAVEQDQALKRAKAGNATLDRQLQVRTTTDELSRQLRDGTLSYDDAPKVYQSTIEKIPTVTIDGLGGVGAEHYQQSIKRLDMAGLASLQPAIDANRTATFRSQADQAIDTIGKQVALGADVNGLNSQLDAYDPIGQVAYGQGWTKVKQNARDRNWYNQASQRAVQSRDNISALQALEQELSDPKGFYADKLDADKRNSLLRGVITDRTQIENRMQHAADRRESAAERTITAVDRQISSGLPATSEMWNGWMESVRGTSQEAELRARISEEETIQNVLRMPIDKQSTYLQERQTELLTKGGNVRDQANLTRLTSAVQANVKQLQDNPLLFIQNRTGVQVAPIDLTQLIQPGGAEQIGEQLRDRVTSISAAQKQYGPQVKMRPLLPQEAAGLASALGDATPRNARDMLGSLRSSINDDGAFTAAMQQIAPDAPVKALAGMLAAKQRKLTLESNVFIPDVVASSGDVAMTLLKGESILNKTKDQKGADGQAKSFPIPKEDEFRTSFNTTAGKVFADRPEAYGVAMQAVRAYYTGKASEDGDVSGEINSSRMTQAVKAVLGQVVNLNNNGKVLAPWGMDEDTFEDSSKSAFEVAMSRHGMTDLIGQYSAMGLRNVGDGTYYVTRGRSYLLDKKGRPVLIDLNKPSGTGARK